MAFYSDNVGSTSYILVTTEAFAASQNGAQTVCSVDAQQQLNRDFKGAIKDWWPCGEHLNLVQPGYDFSNGFNAGNASKVGIGAVPVV